MADALERWQAGWQGTDRVVVATRIGSLFSDESRRVIREGGVDIRETTLRDEQGSLRDEIRNAEVLVTAGTPLDAEAFGQLERARFVLRPYVGYDDLDIDAASANGILVANVPDTFIQEVADQTMALMLASIRKLPRMDFFVREGRWFAGDRAREVAAPIRRLSTMTLGLVGFGNIARLVAQRATPFGFRILAFDPYVPDETAAGTGVSLVSRDELLAESDVLSVHTFLSKETRGMVNAEWFAKMKPGMIIVNTSRGPVIDEAAMIEALQSGRVSAAGLDVFEKEPLDPGSPLPKMENVILEPHLASYSVEGDALHRIRVGHLALQGARGLPERKVVINKNLYDQIVALPTMAGVTKA